MDEAGHSIYIHYRWGHLSVRRSLFPPRDVTDAVLGPEVYGRQIADGLDGFITYDTLQKHLKPQGIILPPISGERIVRDAAVIAVEKIMEDLMSQKGLAKEREYFDTEIQAEIITRRV